jgi:hypothetical protein
MTGMVMFRPPLAAAILNKDQAFAGRASSQSGSGESIPTTLRALG